MSATQPPSPTPTSPTSLDAASHGGTSPSIPVVGRKTGLEGYVDEEGISMTGGTGEGDVEGAQLAWRMKALELEEKEEKESGVVTVEPASPTDPSFPSLSLGTSPHIPISESLFPSTASSDTGTEAQWRAALKEAHRTPTPTAPGSPALPSLELPDVKFTLSLPPPVLPPEHKTSLEDSHASESTPLAHPNPPRPVEELVTISSDFSLHHGDVLDPASLPLPDVPTDYVFPDVHGKASFSREPFSPPPFRQEGEGTTSTPPPASPPLPAVLVFPSPPSAFSSLPSPRKASPLLPPPVTVQSLQPPQLERKGSSAESLIDLYDGGSRHESPDGEANVPAYEDEAAKVFEDEMGREKRVREREFVQAVERLSRDYGVDAPLLLLPSAFSSQSHCSACSRPLPAHNIAQAWVDDHWACIPSLLRGREGGGVRAVVLGGGAGLV